MDKLIVTSLGISLIVFIYWFFFGKKEKVISSTSGHIDIIVDGGYKPNTISIPLGKTTTISFSRKDPSSCLEEVVLSGFNIRKFLPLNQKTDITLTPEKTGVFPFSCGMNMFHGKVIVE